MRELTMQEAATVGGGNYIKNLYQAFKVGYAIGTAYYHSLSTEEQDAIGGTVDAAMHNLGLKEAEDVVR